MAGKAAFWAFPGAGIDSPKIVPLEGEIALCAGDAQQLKTQAMAAQALDAYGNGLVATRLFWGLWLLPFGWLVLKSARMPRLLGILLMLGCLGYLVDVFGALLAPGYADSMIAKYVMLPASIGEIGACLWLLLFGVRMPAPATLNEDMA